jgi:hypothetical protein
MNDSKDEYDTSSAKLAGARRVALSNSGEKD